MKEKLVYILFFMIFVGCSSSNYHMDYNEKINFRAVADEYFSKYNFAYFENLNKSNIAIHSVFIEGDKLSLDNFKEIKLKIEKKWKLVYLAEDQFVFCLNNYNEMSIINPKKLDYYNVFDEKLYIKPQSINNWLITFKYDEDGTRYCNRFIDEK
ncbi:hypothetical protein M5F66_06085 [Acinetobacter sp. ANC 5033]|uniref:hypothetical protein n=1 Tax=Acinetobacter amyesii TaxID=2942470 RepID=UPI00201B96D2|nr:hypothetical protein [Acinetobacter amyesii]MCL6237910.1 hypothetical protein [Acinetobacter amyesii]